MINPKAYIYLATANDAYTYPAHTQLFAVNVGTSAVSAVVTIYHGTSTSDPVVATIDASAKGSYNFHGLRLGKGLFAKLTGGNALVTISVS